MFSALPGEVVAHIAYWIEDTNDILTFRLICRQTRAHSHAAFGAMCFRTITCDLSTTSMTRLQNIASIDDINRQIHLLQFAVDWPRQRGTFGEGAFWPRTRSGCIKDDNCAELNSLRKILSRQWSVCTSFEILDTLYQREAHTMDTTTSLTPTDILAILLDIIDKEKLTATFVSLQLATQTGPIVYGELRPDRFERDPFQGLWGSSLRHLDIAWELNIDDFARAIIRLISKAASLQHLALKLTYSPASDEFLRQLTARLDDHAPGLTALKLSNTAPIEATTMQRFLSLFTETLSSLAFYRANSNHWSSTLRYMQNLPRLRGLTVSHCFDGEYAEKGRVFFCALRSQPSTTLQGKLEITDLSYRKKINRAGGFRYQGSDFKEALPMIADATYVLSPGGPPSPGLPEKSSFDNSSSDKVVQLPKTALDPFGWG